MAIIVVFIIIIIIIRFCRRKVVGYMVPLQSVPVPGSDYWPNEVNGTAHGQWVSGQVVGACNDPSTNTMESPIDQKLFLWTKKLLRMMLTTHFSQMAGNIF